MGTYDHKKVLADYANDHLTVEMALGHTLQHVDKLYELQTNATLNRYALRDRVDTLEQQLATLQAEISRLTGLLEKCQQSPL